jgi:hypothetical protein
MLGYYPNTGGASEVSTDSDPLLFARGRSGERIRGGIGTSASGRGVADRRRRPHHRRPRSGRRPTRGGSDRRRAGAKGREERWRARGRIRRLGEPPRCPGRVRPRRGSNTRGGRPMRPGPVGDAPTAPPTSENSIHLLLHPVGDGSKSADRHPSGARSIRGRHPSYRGGRPPSRACRGGSGRSCARGAGPSGTGPDPGG